MSNCKKCNKNNCCCRKVNINTVINSNSAGRDGLSAYEIAVLEGKYSGSQEDFIDWLKGEEGPQGIPGTPGVSVQDVEVNNDGNLIVTLSNEEEINAGYVKGDNGPEGDSAYQVALNNGFVGTEEEWLESLKGEDGLPGPPGLPGQDGAAGKDGAVPEYRYATNGSFTSPPGIDQSARFPEGWVTSTPVGGPGVYVWESVALINSDDTLYSDWSTPKRVTGLPGANGQDGRSVNIIGQLNTYTELMLVPTEDLNPGDGYILLSDGLLYVWNGEYFPNEGDGLPFIGPQGPPGEDGVAGDGVFKSQVFYVSETEPDTPSGGSWLSPIPTTPGWSDGIPDLEGPRWMSTRIFTLSGEAPQQASWTQPKLLADSADIDIEFSSVLVNPGNPTDNPENWSNDSDSTTEWMAIRKYTNGEWGEWKISKIKGENGMPGQDGQDGQDGSNGNGYEFSYYVANVGEPAPDINTDVGWSTTFPSSISNTQTLWGKLRVVLGSGGFGPWQGPVKLSGDDGQSIQGPSMAYRGDWSSIKQYSGNEYVVDVVKYIPNGRGYIARTDAGQIPLGTLPTDTDYWNEFTLNIDSIFTDFLFSYSAYIQNLTVGQVATGVEPHVIPDPTLSGERFTVGFQPSGINDPTSTLSRHGMRLYFPSGRIMMYQGWVDSFEVGDGTMLSNKGVVIWFKDEENSPVDYYIDGGVIVIVEESDVTRWYPQSAKRLGSNTNEIDNLLFTAGGAEGASFTVKSPHSCWHWNGITRSGNYGITNLSTIYRKVTTVGGVDTIEYVTELNSDTPVPDGIYILSGSNFNVFVVSETDEYCIFDLEVTVHQITGGVVVDQFEYGPNNIITKPESNNCTGLTAFWDNFMS